MWKALLCRAAATQASRKTTPIEQNLTLDELARPQIFSIAAPPSLRRDMEPEFAGERNRHDPAAPLVYNAHPQHASIVPETR